MHKFLFILALFVSVSILYADENKNKNKIEVTAKYVDSNGTTVSASNGVVVYYQDSVIKADKATYNKNTKLLILDGSVEMIGYEGTKEHSKHLELYTHSKEITFEELFFMSENDVWIYSKKANRCENNYTFTKSVLSSCDVNDPLWQMYFSDSIYDANEKYMKVYDAKLYFWDVPVFYTPYLAFSTHKERSSGLLFPLFGYNDIDGFIYEQPIFWAISPSMDIEFNPQIRTNRSVGLYATMRFVDSNHSSGKLRVGYFKDQESFTSEHNLPESSYYGLEFNYESSQVFSHKLSKDFTDGLYINTTYLNDIEYINLQKTRIYHFGLVPIQESRINYFLYNDDYYLGVNAKYFIDTRKENNDKTMQILPAVQFHKYLDHFLLDNFTYNVDFQVTNLDRKEGATFSQAEMKIPLEFTASFFDDYLNVTLGEEFYYSKFFFGNDSYTYDDFQYYNSVHNVKLFTDLTKKYDGFIHVLQPSLTYTKSGIENESPVDFEKLTEEQKDLFSVGVPEEHYTFSVSHYFYDEKMKLKFYQRFSQKYYVDREYKFADITNEMEYNIKKWKFYNYLIYAPEFNKIREAASGISLRKKEYNFSVGHTYKQALEDQPTVRPANDVRLNVGYSYNERIKVSAGVTYNIDEASSTQWKFGGSYNRDCWSMAASIRQDIIPRSTGATTDNTFYIQFNFIPFGGIGTDSLN